MALRSCLGHQNWWRALERLVRAHAATEGPESSGIQGLQGGILGHMVWGLICHHGLETVKGCLWHG